MILKHGCLAARCRTFLRASTIQKFEKAQNMPMPRTPTAILEAKGAFEQNPNRARPNEPTSGKPIGAPPVYLSLEEKRVWRELVKHACPGVLFESDREHFELLTRLTAKMRYHFTEMKASEMAHFISLGSRFAMTPADRSRVTIDRTKKSTLQEFLKRAPTPISKPQLVVTS
jgi:hypothetical protein